MSRLDKCDTGNPGSRIARKGFLQEFRTYAAVRSVLFAAVVLFLLAPGSATAQAPPDLTREQIEANVAKAAGTEPDSYFIETRFVRGGSPGVERTYRSGADFRTVRSGGLIEIASGSAGGQRWHQDANGQTVLDQPDPGNAAKDPYTYSVKKIDKPVDGYLIGGMNAAGLGTRRYIDAKTWRVVRFERVVPQRIIVTEFDDFRTSGGVTRAWHWTVRDGYSDNDADYSIAAFEVRPIAKSDVAIAPPRRRLVEFPSGQTSVKLPVRMLGDQFIVRLDIDGRPLDFMLDTGSSGITIESTVASSLGLPLSGGFINDLNADKYVQSYVRIPEIHVGALTMRDVFATTLPVDWQMASDVHVVGLLGFDFIAEVLLKLDYANGSVTAFPDDFSDLPNTKHTFPIDIRLRNQVPYASLSVNGAVDDRFIIDTGSYGTILFFNYFARRYPHALAENSSAGWGGYAKGAGGIFRMKPVAAKDVLLGNVRFPLVGASIVDSQAAFYSDNDGLIGGKLLRNFDVWIDYANSHVILVARD